MALELVPTLDTQIEVHGFSDAQEHMLQEALPTSLIKERKGPGGRMLKYITGKTSIDAANRIFGFGKWGYRVLSKSHEKAGENEYYTADIELYVLGCPFPFPGEGVGVVTSNNVEGHEKARKEAVTDAMKRALRHFGDQFGLALYSEDALVEDAQGNLVQVKNVHAGASTAPPVKRVVDAKPAQPLRNGNGTVAQPAQHSLMEVKEFFLKYFKPERWTGFKSMVIGMPVDDDGLSDTEVSQLWAKLVSIDEDTKRRKAEAEQETASAETRGK